MTRAFTNALRDIGLNVTEFLREGTLNNQNQAPAQNQGAVSLPQGQNPVSQTASQINTTIPQAAGLFPETVAPQISQPALPQQNTETPDFVVNENYNWENPSGVTEQLSTRVISDEFNQGNSGRSVNFETPKSRKAKPTGSPGNRSGSLRTNLTQPYNRAMASMDWMRNRSLQDSYVSEESESPSASAVSPGGSGGSNRNGTKDPSQRQYLNWVRNNFPGIQNPTSGSIANTVYQGAIPMKTSHSDVNMTNTGIQTSVPHHTSGQLPVTTGNNTVTTTTITAPRSSTYRILTSNQHPVPDKPLVSASLPCSSNSGHGYQQGLPGSGFPPTMTGSSYPAIPGSGCPPAMPVSEHIYILLHRPSRCLVLDPFRRG